MNEVVIYTDGACSGNGTARSVGGWAAILTVPGSSVEKEESGGERPTTNQRMELAAAIGGLSALRKPCKVTLYSDSAYLVRCLQERWYVKWRKNGWISSKKSEVVNRDLWEALLDLVENHGHTVNFVKVAGHADKLDRASTDEERFNQRCDELAVAAADRLDSISV